MALPSSKIEQVRFLRREAANLRGATQRWAEKYRDRAHYDKQAFGFVPRHDRGAAFSCNVGFDAYVGTYGNSSASTSWHVQPDTVQRYFLKALNAHKQAIFDTMATLAEADAASMLDEARGEVAALNALLDEVENGAVKEAA